MKIKHVELVSLSVYIYCILCTLNFESRKNVAGHKLTMKFSVFLTDTDLFANFDM